MMTVKKIDPPIPSPSNCNQNDGSTHPHQTDSIKSSSEVKSMIKNGSIHTIAKFLKKTPVGSNIYLITKNLTEIYRLSHQYAEVKLREVKEKEKEEKKENDCSPNHSTPLPMNKFIFSRYDGILRMFANHEARSLLNNTNGDNGEQNNRDRRP